MSGYGRESRLQQLGAAGLVRVLASGRCRPAPARRSHASPLRGIRDPNPWPEREKRWL